MEQRERSARRLPILGITANTAPENMSRCSETGMDECLIKPTRVAQLREYLARWFGVEGMQRTMQGEAARAAGGNMPRGKHRRGLQGLRRFRGHRSRLPRARRF